MYANDLAPAVRQRVLQSGDVIAQQQCFDFIRSRIFRQTLLCHKHHVIEREFDPKLLRRLFIASSAKPSAGANSRGSNDFVTESGTRFIADSPAGKAMVLTLGKVYP